MEVSYGADRVATHHPELVDVPVGEVGLVHDGHLDVAVVDRLRVVRPVLVTLLPPLLHAPGQHHDGPAVGLPTHPPEVVPGGVQRTLGHDKLSLRVESRDEVGVDVVAAVLVVGGLELHPAVVVRKNVGEPVLGPVDRKIRRRTRLVTAHVLQFLELLAEPEVAVSGHDPVVLREVFQLDWSRGLDDGIRKTDLEQQQCNVCKLIIGLHSLHITSRSKMHEVVWLNHLICTTKLQSKDQITATTRASNIYVALYYIKSQRYSYQVRLTVSVVSERLAAVVTVKLADEDEGEEDDDDQDDGDGDPDQDGGVVGVGADGLRPRGLAELVPTGVRSDLR